MVKVARVSKIYTFRCWPMDKLTRIDHGSSANPTTIPYEDNTKNFVWISRFTDTSENTCYKPTRTFQDADEETQERTIKFLSSFKGKPFPNQTQ